MDDAEQARGFRPRAVEDYLDPDLNPYLKSHLEFGPEVIPAERGPEFKGRWHEAFLARPDAASSGQRPQLHVEIGPGNGFHLSGMAALHPEHDWLGIEIRFKRVVLTARKLRSAGCENARVLRYDAHHLDDLFAEGEIDALYVHHPDPWKREKRAKHRLLLRPFAEWICRALRPGGEMRIKSDFHSNLDDFEGLLEGLPLRVVARVDDLRAQGLPWPERDDVTTNYQSKFDKRGLPVAAMLLRRD